MKHHKLFCLGAFLFIVGCLGKSSEEAPASAGRSSLVLKFKNSQLGAHALSDDNLPLLFGYVDIAAYDYRPGESVQINNGAGGVFNDANWSRWTMVPGGQSGAQDFILPSGGALNLRNLATSQGGGDYFYQDITEDWVKDVGVFSMDIISVKTTPAIINASNQVCGDYYLWAKSTNDFPSLQFGQCPKVLKSAYDNTYLFMNTNIIFARKDWFSQPIQLYLSFYPNTSAGVDCVSSDVPLSAFQIELLDSLLPGIQPGGWPAKFSTIYNSSCLSGGGYGFSVVSIVPQQSDVPVIQFTAKKVKVPPVVSPDGNSVPQPPATVIGQSIEAIISFNLRPSMFVNYSALNDPSDTSTIMVNRSSDGMPWGLSIEFAAVTPAILP